MVLKAYSQSTEVLQTYYNGYAELVGEVLQAKTDPLIAWLARLRLVEQVPFAYLVPHAELLPPESIRFFYLNRNWTDAAMDGALSVGAITSLDRELVAAAHGALRAEVDEAERSVRQVEDSVTGEADVITGFLLRSRAVSGWPELQVHALRTSGARLRFLRFERLAPAVLLVLIDGIPDRIEIEEPRQGIQFGVDQHSTGATAQAKDPATGVRIDDEPPVPVPFRADAPGVVHIQALAENLNDVTFDGSPLVTDVLAGSDELAIQLLQFPYQQPFGTEVSDPNWFRATAPVDVLVVSHGGAING